MATHLNISDNACGMDTPCLNPANIKVFAGLFACLTPCPLSLAKGEGVPPRHPAVHLAANGATPPLEGRGVFPKVCCEVEIGFGTLGAVLTESAKLMPCAFANAKEDVLNSI